MATKLFEEHALREGKLHDIVIIAHSLALRVFACVALTSQRPRHEIAANETNSLSENKQMRKIKSPTHRDKHIGASVPSRHLRVNDDRANRPKEEDANGQSNTLLGSTAFPAALLHNMPVQKACTDTARGT